MCDIDGLYNSVEIAVERDCVYAVIAIEGRVFGAIRSDFQGTYACQSKGKKFFLVRKCRRIRLWGRKFRSVKKKFFRVDLEKKLFFGREEFSTFWHRYHVSAPTLGSGEDFCARFFLIRRWGHLNRLTCPWVFSIHFRFSWYGTPKVPPSRICKPGNATIFKRLYLLEFLSHINAQMNMLLRATRATILPSTTFVSLKVIQVWRAKLAVNTFFFKKAQFSKNI